MAENAGRVTLGVHPALLQRRIVRAGETTRQIRGLLVRLPALALVLLFAGGFLTHVLPPDPRRPDPQAGTLLLYVGLSMLVVGLLAGTLLVLPAASAYRARRQAEFRQELSRLPPEQIAQVLLPLEHHRCYDTASVVEPLIRELVRNRHEIAPAASPQGAGSEPAPPSASCGT